MTNYSQTTFFAPKDTLPATDPNKTIFGAAYDIEFANIAAAIASKPDASASIVTFQPGGTVFTGAAGGQQGAGTVNATGLFVNGTAVAPVSSSGGFFTVTYTGFTAGNTQTAVYAQLGSIAVLWLPAGVATSNATTFTATGVPASARPSASRTLHVPVPYNCVTDNGITPTNVTAVVDSTGTVTFRINGNAGGWAAANNKGVNNAFCLSYLLNG